MVTLFTATTHASVRAISVDEHSMAEIYLSMGRSTVLHFSEQPIKIIAGNQNYFNIEFTGQDVTIQPLGAVVSNLFVYGEYRRYGFILNSSFGGKYDDLVQVTWKTDRIAPKVSQLKAVKENQRVFSRAADITLTKRLYDKSRQLHILELEFKNKAGRELEVKNITITANQNTKRLKINQIVFNADKTTHQDLVLKARVFLRTMDNAPITLSIGIGNNKTTLRLSEKLTE